MISTLNAGLKASLLALCAMLLFATCNVHAELVAVPALTTHVTDLTQTLSAEEQHQLDAKLMAFEQQKGSQIAVLIVPTTQPEDIAQYANRVARAWKLGRQKQQDGVLMVVAKDDHKMRIEVDSGLQGAIPDVYAKRIVSDLMAPKFKQGDYFGGINAGLDKVMAFVAGEALAAPTANDPSSRGNNFAGMLPFLLFGALILGGILRAIFGNFFGGTLTGGAIGALALILGGGVLAAIVFGIVAFVITLIGPAGLSQMGGYSGGLGGGMGGGSNSGGWSGGGGSSGWSGGGASGDW